MGPSRTSGLTHFFLGPAIKAGISGCAWVLNKTAAEFQHRQRWVL